MAPLQITQRLATEAGRLPGSEQDRRATAMLAAELESMGRRPEIEEIRVRPAWHLSFAMLAALAAGGTVLSTISAPAGAVLLLVTAAAMYGDLVTSFHTLRLATPRRRTANVSAAERLESPAARVILTAHHDAGRTGLLYARPRRKRPARRRRRATLTSPLHFLFWSTMVALVAAIARLAVENEALTAVQFVLADLRGLALGLKALAAHPAVPARDVERDHDPVPGRDVLHLGADLLHDAHRLMAEDVAVAHEGAHHLVEVEVRAADRRGGHAHDRVGAG